MNSAAATTSALSAGDQITVALTLRATLAEGLGRPFAFERGLSVKLIYLFVVRVATSRWFVDSLLPEHFADRAAGVLDFIGYRKR
ncbi:MAG: hypothetical protein ACREAB_12985 [Blastocatellia bacterium]